MTTLADVCRLDMQRTFPGRFDTVVATCAVSGDVQVAEICWQPGHRTMTVVAYIAALNMCRVLTGRSDPIVTTTAGPNHLRVIDRHDRRPDIGVVAVLTDV